MIRLELLGTAGCHLCEEAEQLMTAVASEAWRTVEVAADETLLQRYGHRIPVLRCARSGAELGWPFTAGSVAAFIATLESTAGSGRFLEPDGGENNGG